MPNEQIRIFYITEVSYQDRISPMNVETNSLLQRL